MTKTTKLWISPALELRHAINGWPEPVSPLHDTLMYTCNGVSAYSYSKATEIYEQCLAKAKEESIIILGVYLSQNFKWEPDTFIDFAGEVEVVWQYYDHEWRDCVGDPVNYMDYMTRQVARLKPVGDIIGTDPGAHSFTEAHEVSILEHRIQNADHPFADQHRAALEHIKLMRDNRNPEDFMDSVKSNLFTSEYVREMMERINELEHDNAEGFEKYQDLIIQNRNLKERVKELEAAQSNNLHINRDMLNGLNDKLPV